MDAKAEASLTADVKLTGAKSQTFLVAGLLVPTFMVGLAAYLALSDKPVFAFIFLLSALGLYGLLGYLWKLSHANQDLDNAKPVVLTSPSGAKFSTDARVLRDPDMLKAVATTLGNVLGMKPIPDAAGLVDENGVIIPNSEGEANRKVADINDQVKRSLNSFMERAQAFDQAAETVAVQSLGPTDEPNSSPNSA